MTNKYEHPAVTWTERTGYPEPVVEPAECPKCRGELSGTTYTIEIKGEYKTVCVECFRDWLADYADTNPTDIADALHVDWTPAVRSVLFP